ncbi:MAG: DUF4230 domain-containing protein [Sphingobium sp.]|uniref:DUF4230 domain-containing protein n=1 Tax=Sphingobium sp. TaxID=1912891 RepID=UPI0029B380B9|nr:DUF4230 domain-containing protein [Sphingobium sp.]MDX3911342.1 DUF4230 domain-containing protein [Sphingobium sp.]
MSGTGKVPLFILLAVAFGVGYWAAPREILDSEVRHSGFFRTDTTKVLSATVESLRLESKLQVFSYKGTAKVVAERRLWWIFGGRQELMVPAVVNYYVDLSKLTLDQVSFNERAKVVTVKLPALEMSDIAFQPENATTINGGLLTFSDEQVEQLRKMNYASARDAMVKQAQGKGLFETAKNQARQSITTYFEIPLRIAGQPDVKVVARF